MYFVSKTFTYRKLQTFPFKYSASKFSWKTKMLYIYIYIKKKQNNTDGRNIVNIFCKKKEEIL